MCSQEQLPCQLGAGFLNGGRMGGNKYPFIKNHGRYLSRKQQIEVLKLLLTCRESGKPALVYIRKVACMLHPDGDLLPILQPGTKFFIKGIKHIYTFEKKFERCVDTPTKK
jgi:hypothetical protein